MIRPFITCLCALLISPAWSQEPPNPPADLLARCLHEEGLYFGRRLLWADVMKVYLPLAYDVRAMNDQCDPQMGRIFGFDVETMDKLAKGSAYIVEHCPMEKMRYPKAWIEIDWDLNQSTADAGLLEDAERNLAEWEGRCGEVVE